MKQAVLLIFSLLLVAKAKEVVSADEKHSAEGNCNTKFLAMTFLEYNRNNGRQTKNRL